MATPLYVSVFGPIKTYYRSQYSAWQKNNANKVLSAKHAEKAIMSRWQIPPQCPAWCAWRKKAQCHDGKFAMATICEILQKLNSTFFWMPSKTKESAVSWWPIRDGRHSQNFAKMNFDFYLSLKQGERKCSVMKATSRWPYLRNFAKIYFWRENILKQNFLKSGGRKENNSSPIWMKLGMTAVFLEKIAQGIVQPDRTGNGRVLQRKSRVGNRNK